LSSSRSVSMARSTSVRARYHVVVRRPIARPTRSRPPALQCDQMRGGASDDERSNDERGRRGRGPTPARAEAALAESPLSRRAELPAAEAVDAGTAAAHGLRG